MCIPTRSSELDDSTSTDAAPIEAPTKNDGKTDQVKALAQEIYNTFIDHNSSTQVNLSSKQREEVKSAIDSGQLARETFDTAQKEIFSVMSRDSYPRFLQSKKNRTVC